MDKKLTQRIAELLSQPRPIKPQTQRQLEAALADRNTDQATFLLCAAEILEEDELDILFAPQFTPALEDQVAVADLLYHWRPTENDIKHLPAELEKITAHALIVMPDGAHAKLTIHEVMIERFVRLLRLDKAPPPATAAALRDTLAGELWPLAAALLRQRGFDQPKQEWFARFINHMAEQHPIDRGLLITAAQFVAEQDGMDTPSLIKDANAQIKAANKTVAYARRGRAYWSDDVAQHHQYRGQGQVDTQLIEQRQNEAACLEIIASDLQTFDSE